MTQVMWIVDSQLEHSTYFKRNTNMVDYLDCVDFNAIKLGDLANDVGDDKCAIESYSKALNKLRKYQGIEYNHLE